MPTILDTVSVAAPTVLEFSNNNIRGNFSHFYVAELAQPFYITNSFTLNTGLCLRGCGSPNVQYTWYSANGFPIKDTSVVMSAGSYGLGVRGTGMGSGNTTSYTLASTFVSPVPEPGDVALLGISLLLLGAGVKLNKLFSR